MNNSKNLKSTTFSHRSMNWKLFFTFQNTCLKVSSVLNCLSVVMASNYFFNRFTHISPFPLVFLRAVSERERESSLTTALFAFGFSLLYIESHRLLFLFFVILKRVSYFQFYRAIGKKVQTSVLFPSICPFSLGHD